MQTVPTFLAAFSPRWMCGKCLARLMERDETTVIQRLSELVSAGDVEAMQHDCFNCEVPATVFRTRPRPGP